MAKWYVGEDERFPTLVVGEDQNGVDIPQYLISELRRAENRVKKAEERIVEHLVETGQPLGHIRAEDYVGKTRLATARLKAARP